MHLNRVKQYHAYRLALIKVGCIFCISIDYYLILFPYQLSTMEYECILCVDVDTTGMCDMTYTSVTLWLSACQRLSSGMTGIVIMNKSCIWYICHAMPQSTVKRKGSHVVYFVVIWCASGQVAMMTTSSVYKVDNMSAFVFLVHWPQWCWL